MLDSDVACCRRRFTQAICYCKFYYVITVGHTVCANRPAAARVRSTLGVARLVGGAADILDSAVGLLIPIGGNVAARQSK